MAAPTNEIETAVMEGPPAGFKPYTPDEVRMPEFTISALLLGSVLGIVFAASSLYLVLKVGMTVSASIPVAVLAITVFRAFSRAFGLRRATILENNIVQTAGSAGESIAFGVGVTMPAMLLLGFQMDLPRVMVVSLLGGLLGILAMIPLRRAFIVKLHGKPGEPGTLLYPEGTACAQVLISGETGGAAGKTIFFGFGLAFLHKIATEGMNLFIGTARVPLTAVNKAAVFAGEMASELLGVGYIIGMRTSSIMMAGAVLGYLIIIPLISFAGDLNPQPLPPGKKLIKEMSTSELRNNYLLFIGAGCVATAGIISMFRTLPMIVRSVQSGLQSIRGSSTNNSESNSIRRRTENDMSMTTVLLGSLVLLGLLAAFLMTEVPFLAALAGALLVVVFGFLFVTVSARLTGEIGSSSNPISGMTVATLTLTCLIFLGLGWTTSTDRVLALSIAAVVCVAASNGGTTAQSLKTGFLVGGTPRMMQYAILIGAITSALVIGFTLLGMNNAGTVYSEKKDNLPTIVLTPQEVREITETETYEGETYRVWDTHRELKDVFSKPRNELKNVAEGRYLVDDAGRIRWVKDPKIMGKLNERDDGSPVKRDADAPKTQVMGLIINGVLKRELNWTMVIIGALIAVMLELCGVSSLAFAVGVYVPIQYSTPIFIGGIVRWAVDRYMASKASTAIAQAEDAEAKARAEIEAIRKSETSPGVLLAAGLIAGGSLGGMLLAFLQFSDDLPKDLAAWQYRKYEVTQAKPITDLAQDAALQELGYLSGSPSTEQKKKVNDLAEEIKALNSDVPVLWVSVPKGTKLKLPEYQKYDVPVDTTLGDVAAKLLGGKDRVLDLYSLNKKILGSGTTPGVIGDPTLIRVPQGTQLTLPLKKTYEVEQDAYLADLAKQLLGRKDKAQVLMNLNKDQLKIPERLPAGAELKLPQYTWPALVLFGMLVLLLGAVGADMVLRVKEA